MRDQVADAARSARTERRGTEAGARSRPAVIELPCRSHPELFFAEAPDELLRAKALCRLCAMRSSCLAGALQRREPWGVWGGQLLLRGEVIPDKRPRGRPRKASVAA